MLQTKWRFLWMLVTGVVIALVIREIAPLPSAFAKNTNYNVLLSFLQSTLITFAIWESTLWFDHWINKFIPWEKSFSLRFVTVMAGGMLICIAHFMLIGSFFNAYICPFPLLENENLFKLCLGIALNVSLMILLIEFGFQLFRKWKHSLVEIEKHKAETMQAKLASLQHQVNPHFLFNNMSVLTSLIYKDQDKAAEFVQQLSKVYRYLLDNSQNELVTLGEEIQFLNAYIYLLQIRYSPNLSIETTLEDRYLQRLIPPSSIQLLLENAIKHNEVSNEKKLHIHLHIENEKFVVTNSRSPKLSEEKTGGTGLKNIQKRYAFFTDIPVEITHNSTQFEVRIPLLELS